MATSKQKEVEYLYQATSDPTIVSPTYLKK